MKRHELFDMSYPDEFEVPDVSVLIPAHNEAGSIERAIRSVTDLQRGTKVEVIVGNDASTDNTVEIVKQFPNVILTNSTKNIGKGKMLNRMLNRATGRYILVLDADDALEKDALTLLVGRTDDFLLTQDDKRVFAHGCTQYHGASSNKHVPKRVPASVFFKENPVCSVVLVPREELLKSGVLFPSDPAIFEDWFFIASLVKAKFRSLPYPEILVLHYTFDNTGRYQKLIENDGIKKTRDAINGK